MADPRQVPADIEAERQVLGSLILRPDLTIQVSSIITRNDFFSDGHRFIYDAILTLSNDSSNDIDPITVVQYLQDRSQLNLAGGNAYIMRLVEDVLAPNNAPLQAERIRNIALRRDLINAAHQIEVDAREPQENEGSFLKQVEESILKITSKTSSRGVLSAAEMQSDFFDYFEHLIAARGGMSGLPTRYEEFDNRTSGLRGGELLILAARPGMGKSTFAMNIAMNLAISEQPAPILFFTLEMSRLEVLLRVLCAHSQTNHADLKRGHIPQGKKASIQASMDAIFKSPIFMDDTGALSIWDCISRTRKLAMELRQKGQKLGLVVVDYLQLMSDPENRKFGRQMEVASISRALKQLAMSEDVPILALSQMNRSVEQRRGESARPQLSDLRESGALEQDADMVMFIHRDAPADGEDQSEHSGQAEIIISKYRAGRTGGFFLAYRPELFRFDNLLDAGSTEA